MMDKIKQHFNEIERKTNLCYEVAEKARARGLDPVSKVEIPIATSLAEKSVSLVSVLYPQLNDKKIIQRIIELENEYGPLEMSVSLKIAEEIARGVFCRFENLIQAIDAGIRVGFAYITLGVVSSPIEGFTGIKIGKTRNNEEYLIAYFSGPIRSAGTTAGCVVLMIIDYLREYFGFAKYDPTEEEIRRYVTENYDYHERVTNLQYLPTEEEIVFLAKNLPIQISGEPTENREVSNYKDLPRIETNFIRGGMCLIFSEGLAQKAQKGFRLLKKSQERGFVATGWNFLEDYISLHKKREKGIGDSSPTYINDLVAGRPVYGHPSRSGGFRFRYGLSRTNGFSATSVHPATMIISNSFISFGSQLKIEKPTKGCAVSACDSIDGPIVKLHDGTVLKINSVEEALKISKDLSEIIYLGDMLFSLGDLINRNYELLKPGYVEEWWALELAKNCKENNFNIDSKNISFDEAIDLSNKYKIPLHPSYIYYWTQITKEMFFSLLDWLGHTKIYDDKIVLPFSQLEQERFHQGKRALEIIGCPHKASLGNVIIKNPDAKALLFNLGVSKLEDFETNFEKTLKKISEPELLGLDVLSLINSVCPINIKDKAGTFIGCRMGRPEKAKLRKLVGNPHVLFPVGKEGGKFRSIQEALSIGSIKSNFSLFYCSNCKTNSVYPKCIFCDSNSMKLYHCSKCDKYSSGLCEEHKEGKEYAEIKINITNYFENARSIAKLRNDEVPMVKGIRGTSNKNHICENLTKGLLRSFYNLNVNKDGTIRYDVTEMPLNHFKPKEIGSSIEKLVSLGYTKDIYGNDLVNEEQILEIYPHDIVLPSCPISPDERADDVFLRVCSFIDDSLERIYGLPRFYNAKKREDLIGNLFICIAPHICTATVGRLIGFSKTQSLLASPFMHAAMRRDCDGDEAAVILLLDALINFSRSFLPAHRGGTQDAPLVLNTRISAREVDDQILDFELGTYPLELYELAEAGKHSSEVIIDNVKSRLKKGLDVFSNKKFTHDTKDFNACVLNSSYKSIPTMQEKVFSMMELCKKIRAVDVKDVARLIIERHFIRDIKGNLRKFSMQVFRCVDCNAKYRRPPLSGRCGSCGGKLIFTISEGSIIKYLSTALDIARTYRVSDYLIECLEIIEKDIEGIFGKEKEKQEALRKWF